MWRPTRVTPLIQTQTHSSIFMLNSSEVSIVGKCRKYTHTQMKLLISVETSQTTYREVRYSLLFYYIILLLSPMQSFCLCNFLVKVIIHNARMIISKFKFLKYISTSTYTHPPPPPPPPSTHTACPEAVVGTAPWIIAIAIIIPLLVLGLLALLLLKVLLLIFVSHNYTVCHSYL